MTEEQELTIKFLVDRVIHYDFDNLQRMVLETNIQVKSDSAGEIPIAYNELLWEDRFGLYRQFWKLYLDELYSKYLPGYDYNFIWTMEITPYTLLLISQFENKQQYDDEIQLHISQKKIKEENLITSLIEGFKLIDVDVDQFSEPLKKLFPATELSTYKTLLRLLNFPPLEELGLFYGRVHKKYSEGLSSLHKIFSNGPIEIPSLKVTEPYHNSVFYISHQLFEKYGLDGFEKMEELKSYKSEFASIRAKSELNKDKFKGKVVCGCCGKIHETTVPEQMLQYKFLLEHRELSKNIGFILLEDVKKEYYTRFSEKFSYIINNLNPSTASKLLILVEGASEEVGLPILAFKRRLMLTERSIKVYNSQSKEKVLSDFKAFKSKYKDLKMLVLLDSDATKEKAELERMIKNRKHKYDLCFIEKGTWEDLFPLEKSVQILNEIYTEGDEIILTDFDTSKDFTKEAGRILFEKKKASFDKVLFSKKICWSLQESEIPEQITVLFDLAEKLLPAEDSIFKNAMED